MKTIAELNALIPQLIKLVFEDPEIGKTHCGKREDDMDTQWEYNYVCYEKDGWLIEIEFKCTGLWQYYPGDYYSPADEACISAWGEVMEINASHTDEDGEETIFEWNDLKELYDTLNHKLSSF